MKFLLKSVTVLLLISVAAFQLEAQNESDWSLHHEDAKVRVEYIYQDCNIPSKGTNNQYVYLKITNLTGNTLQVEFDRWAWYNGQCRSCNGNAEHHKVITLQPNETLSGSCGAQANRNLQIFSKMLNGMSKSELTKFQLANITTSTIED